MHDHIRYVNHAKFLMRASFGPILAAMVAYRAPLRRALTFTLTLGAAAALLGCAGKTDKAVASAGSGGAGMQVDPTRCDAKGKQTVVADTNQDKKPDVTKLYETRDLGGQKSQILTCKQVDLNYDNRVDIVYHYDQGGAISFEEFDLDFDGRYDLWTYYQSAKKVREEMDTNYDRRPDFTKYFENDKLVRVERDTNNDGRVDEWQYFEGGKLDRIGYDSTGSGRADKWDRAPETELPGATASDSGGGAPPAPTGAGALTPANTTAPPPPPPPPPAPSGGPPGKK
jgi:hypothetical protein